MKKGLLSCIAAVTMMASNAAMADDLEGKVEAVDAGNQTFVVQGITFHVTKKTDYDDGLRQFNPGQLGTTLQRQDRRGIGVGGQDHEGVHDRIVGPAVASI